MATTHTNPDIPIIYEDEDLLIINKPVNVLSQADHTGDPDVLSLCKHYLSHKRNNRHSFYLGLLHRLDRPVGGLMMLAKNSKAAQKMSQQINDRTVIKTYWAIVLGKPPANGMLTHFLLKDRKTNTVKTVGPGNKNAKKAVLSYRTIQNSENLSLLSIDLQTGRSHQIRVQFSAEGYPLYGDQKYGGKQVNQHQQIALRATYLRFEHPRNHKEMEFKQLPEKAEPWSKFDMDKIELF